jgi:hypothetical protein
VFRELCVLTEGDLGSVGAEATRSGFEPFDFSVAMRRDVLKLKRRAVFRKPGYFLTTEQFEATEKGKPMAVLNTASLLAKPVSFEAVQSRFVATFGEPNRRDLVGVGVSFVSVAGSSERPVSYEEANARHEAGEGDLIDIGLNEVRDNIHVPSDTTSMSYTRWIR